MKFSLHSLSRLHKSFSCMYILDHKLMLQPLFLLRREPTRFKDARRNDNVMYDGRWNEKKSNKTKRESKHATSHRHRLVSVCDDDDIMHVVDRLDTYLHTCGSIMKTVALRCRWRAGANIFLLRFFFLSFYTYLPASL